MNESVNQVLCTYVYTYRYTYKYTITHIHTHIQVHTHRYASINYTYFVEAYKIFYMYINNICYANIFLLKYIYII